MEAKILKHYQNWLKLRSQNDTSAPINQPSSPIIEEANNEQNESFIKFPLDSNTAVKVFENDQIEIYIKKSFHQRQKRFRIQDSMYHIKVKVKENATHPLLFDLLDVFERAFSFILKNIQTYFNPEDINEMYLTLYQNNMLNGLNSPGVRLQDNPKEVVDNILDMLYRFLISENNIDLELNDTFQVYIHILSIDHVEFKKRNPRTKQANKRKKHYGVRSKKAFNNLYNWTLEIPEGYGQFPQIFKNECLLISVILGHLQNEFHKSNRTDKRIIYAQNINSKLKVKRIYAGNIIQTELRKLKKNLNLNCGPYEITSVAPKLCSYFKCQIFIFEGVSESSNIKAIYPNEVDDQLEPIYLYEPPNQENHVLLIRSISAYFRLNGKICIYCKKRFKHYKFIHRCLPKLSCFACRRRFKIPTTYVHQKLERNYCDIQITKEKINENCPRCNLFLRSKSCKTAHKLLCNGKGHFGWYCKTCKKFTSKTENLTSDQIKANHQCGVTLCRICRQSQNDEENPHICQLRQEKPTKFWPTVAFLDIEFRDFNIDDCVECFEIKKQFKEENLLSWQQVFEDKQFPNLCCDLHLENQINIEPLLFAIYKEHRVLKGQFIRHIITDFSIDKNICDILSFNYCENVKNSSKFIPVKKLTLNQKLIKNNLKTTNNNIIEQFFDLILSEEWSNTTFIIQDYDSFVLNYLLKEIIKIGLTPNVVRDGRKIFVLEIQDLGIKFLRSNNFFEGDEFQIAKMFEISHTKTFFPHRLNNINYQGNVPDIKLFLDFKDSDETRKEKHNFVDNRKRQNSKWCYEKELIFYVEEKLRLLSLSFLTFLKESFNLQNELQIELNDAKEYIHPLANNICSISGFIFKIYRLLYMNKLKVFTVLNEYGQSCNHVSQQEYEWVSYMHFKFPNKKFQSIFSHPRGQKTFPESCPDLYCAEDKEAWYYNGCYFHSHYDQCKINPSATAETQHPLFKKTFLELNSLFEEKLAKLLQNHPNELNKINIIWECQYLEMRNSPDIQNFLNFNFKPRPLYRLSPRAAVRGGYTDTYALKWNQTENPNENFYCLDQNGMYSYIALKFKFCLGPYKIIIGDEIQKINFQNLEFFFDNDLCPMSGTMLLTILPPRNLFYPFLPYRLKNEKTVYTLCVECAENKTIKCNHVESQRAITSVYFISEIKFAITLGYKIIQIHECHYYKQTDYILKEFVQKLSFLRMKHTEIFKECCTLEEKEEYCTYLNNIMEFTAPNCLTPTNVSPNESKKRFYKSMINSIFGKLEQRSDKPKTRYVRNQADLNDIYFSNFKIVNLFCINDDLCELEIKADCEKLLPNRETCLYIGAQLVAYSREVMYQTILEVDKVGKVFYVDCDCCFFSLNKSLSIPLLISDAIGHFKHIYNKKITSFYCLGPKNYSISFENESDQIKTITKIKGLSLSSFYLKNEINSSTFDYFISQNLTKEVEQIKLAQIRHNKSDKLKDGTPKLKLVAFTNKVTNRRIFSSKCKYLTSFPFGNENASEI